MIIILNSHT